MITAFLEFFHDRKWIAELLLVLAIVGAVTWFCHHLIEVGVQQQKDADAAQYAKLKEAADKETGRLQGIADTAEKARDQELSDLRNYRNDNPISSLRVCHAATSNIGGMPQATPTNSGNAQATAATDVGNPMHSGDSRSGEQQSADVGPLLDAFGAIFDEQTATLREWKARE